MIAIPVVGHDHGITNAVQDRLDAVLAALRQLKLQPDITVFSFCSDFDLLRWSHP